MGGMIRYRIGNDAVGRASVIPSREGYTRAARASDSVRRTRNPKSSGPSKGAPGPPPIAIFSTGTRNRGISSGFAKRTAWTALNDDFQYGHEQVHTTDTATGTEPAGFEK